MRVDLLACFPVILMPGSLLTSLALRWLVLLHGWDAVPLHGWDAVPW